MKTLPRHLPRLLPRRGSYPKEYASLFRLGGPVFVTQLGTIVVSFMDTVMVGAYGTRELAASAFVNSLYIVMFVMLMGFAGGVTPLAGALFGRKDNHGAGRILRASLQLNVLLGVAFTAIMGLLYFLLDRMGQDADLLPLICPYYLIVLAGLIPISIFSCCQQMANGVTDTQMPMWIILGGNALNIAGNYLLIFGKFGCPEMGLTGAGISTLISRLLCAVAIVWMMLSRRRYKPFREGFFDPAPCGNLRKQTWHTSYPLMIQSGLECVLWSIGAVVSGWFGKIQIAAYQVVNIAGQVGFMTYLSFGTATSIRVANQLGEDNIEGIRLTTRAGLRINLVLASAASLIFLLFMEPLLHVFTPDADVVHAGMALTVPLILYQYCDATQITFANAQRGTSVVKPLLWVALVSYVLTGVPVMLFMAKSLGLESVGVYYSFCVALLIAAVMMVMIYRRTLRSMFAQLSSSRAKSDA